MKKKTIKGVKGFAIISNKSIFKIEHESDYPRLFAVFKRKREAQDRVISKYNHIVKVLITPITKVTKNKVGK